VDDVMKAARTYFQAEALRGQVGTAGGAKAGA
jgi:hypothetical protein